MGAVSAGATDFENTWSPFVITVEQSSFDARLSNIWL